MVDLMDISEQESSGGAIAPESLLGDAKFHILAMIADHVEFANPQVSLLQMLASWLTEIRNRQQSSESPVDAEIAGLVESVTLTALRERINQQARGKATRLSDASEDVRNCLYADAGKSQVPVTKSYT
jgi:hypothetical protein